MLARPMVSLLLAVALMEVSPPPPPPSDGGIESMYTNTGTNGGAVDVAGSQTIPGSNGSNSGGTGYTEPVVHVEPPTRFLDSRCVTWTSYHECIYETSENTDDETTPVIPEITLTDLASFAPDPAALTAEPNNLGVAGLPTNLVTAATTHTQNGTLFGYPIAVRFTPDIYTFHHGDDTSTASNTPGTTWDTLHQAQFTPTDTSHTYTERGTYTARVDITYTAEIDLGIGWFPITGHLNTTGTPQTIRIYEAHTALVARTCTEQPTAPGC